MLLLISAKAVAEIPQNRIQKKESTGLQLPRGQLRVHRVGNIATSMTNWGFFGSYTRSLMESSGGCFMINPDTLAAAPSFEFPIGSNLEYLWDGGIWIGGVLNGETLVSVGLDGWLPVMEMVPEAPILEKSTRMSASCYSTEAVSEQDIIAIFSDTLNTWFSQNIKPLYIKINQKSMSWSSKGIDNFFVIEYIITNMNDVKIDSVYVGLLFDPDIGYYPGNFFWDDITGFKEKYISGDETLLVNIAWSADNDGDPEAGIFTYKSPTGVIALKVLETPNPDLRTSFNWWVNNTDPSLDWGPWKLSSIDKWRSGDTTFILPGLGTPEVDKAKYFLMSNGEYDYDQIYSCLQQPGWLPPHILCATYVTTDTRFLYSFGPFNLNASDSLKFAVALMGVDSFHVDPNNTLIGNPPDSFYQKLNFDKLIRTALKADSWYHTGCFAVAGDVTYDDKISTSDIIALINHLFKSQPAPDLLCRGDADADDYITQVDLVYLINYLFKHSTSPLKSGACCL